MTETTYDIIAKSLDRISMELHQADENNDFLRIGLLSGQLKAIKEDLHRLLWIELPELNDSHKIKAISQIPGLKKIPVVLLEIALIL